MSCDSMSTLADVKDKDNDRNISSKSQKSLSFALHSAEKRGERSDNVRYFLSSIWRSDVAKVETKRNDEVIRNDIFKICTDYETDSESHFYSFQSIDFIHRRPGNKTKTSLSDKTGSSHLTTNKEGKETANSNVGNEKSTINIPLSEREKLNMIKDNNTRNICHLKDNQNIRKTESVFSTDFVDTEESTKGTFEDELKLNENRDDESKEHTVLEYDDDSSTRTPNIGTTSTEDQNSEEELEFIEMMTTFDRVFPDENDSSTLHELVIKQGLETRTSILFDAIEEFAMSNGFEMKDSSPNGNCMFHAVNDQLKINGDFRFDEMSLRSKAVSYLKRHPKNKEDIHLECFLINEETWDAYLTRMSKSKEWGDHLILKALCEVLSRKIIVHNVQSSDKFTTHEFKPEWSEVDGKETLFLGHLGEFHYVSLRPTDWKQTWLSKIIQANGNDKCYLEDKRTLYNDMVMRDPFGFDIISQLSTPLFSVLLSNLIALLDISILKIPSALYCSNKKYDIETAGARSDGTEVFIIHKKPSVHTAEYYRRLDTEFPLMIMVAIDEPVICTANPPCLDSFIYAETANSHAGYCRLLCKSKGSQVYMRGWDVLPNEDPNSMKSKRSLSGFPCPEWPACASEWLTRRTSTDWPKDSLKEDIAAAGILVVKKAHPASSTPETEWMFLFHNAEKLLVEKGMSEWQKHVFYVFKIVVDYFTKTLKRRLHTVHLKSIFFFACEEINADLFMQLPGYCFLYLFQKLLNCLNEKYLPNYFIKENNMIDQLADLDIMHLMDVIEVVRINPLQCLTFLLEEYGHHRSWIVDIVTNGFDKIHAESPNSNIFDIVIPTMVRLAQHLARDEMFYHAYCKITAVKSYLAVVPIRKNGKVLPTPSITFLLRESFKTLDDFTQCRLAQSIEINTGLCMFSSEIPAKRVKDLTNGENIGGLGDEFLPVGVNGDEYLEARHLNGLGVRFHNKTRNYPLAIKYYVAAIDHLEKSSEKILSEIESGGTDDNQARRYNKMLENDSLCFLCFQNISKCYWDVDQEEIIKLRMPVLEKICRRSYGQEANSFLKKLRERLGNPGRGSHFHKSPSLEENQLY